MAASRRDRVLGLIEAFIRAQYARNAGVTLSQIARDECAPYDIHPALMAFAVDERQGIAQALRDEVGQVYPAGEGIVDLFVTSTKEFIYQNNQFITLSAGDQWALAELYLEFVADIANGLARARRIKDVEGGFQGSIERHLAALQSFVAGLERQHAHQGISLVHDRVACEEYSAGLQLGILGIDLGRLAEPILDVGCGRRGELVHHLRQAGLEAYGLDRLVLPDRHLVEVDWLQYHFQPSAWGTIVSHMAFSNHFVFHHLYRGGVPQAYAARFMDMLAALRPGGALYYAPGLPFIEALLPASRYRVSRKPLDVPGWPREELPDVAPDFGNELFYATRITRLD